MSLPRTVRTAVLVAALAIVPAVALAGDTVTDGTNLLKLEIGVTPAKPGAPGAPRGVALRFQSTLSTRTGVRPQGLTRIDIRLAAGMRFNAEAVAQCRETVLAAGEAPPDATKCPTGSRVGTGTAVADARPGLPEPVNAPLQIFNAIIERDVAGNAIAPRPGLLIYAEAVGVKTYFAGEFRRGGQELYVPLGAANPAEPGLFTLTALDVRLRKLGRQGRPYLQAPARCRGGFAFSETYTLSGRPLTARDRVRCTMR